MAVLSLTNSELYAELGRELGISRNPADWGDVTDVTTTAADVDRIVRSGRRRFFSANDWNFLEEDLQILTVAPVTAGTITVVAGVVTFSIASTPPTDSVNYLFEPDGGGAYSVASFDSTTQITLNDTSLAVDAGSTFSMYKVKYDLPAAFGGWIGPIVLENYNGQRINESRNFPDYVIRAFQGRQTVRSDKPELFSVTSTTDSETAIATHQLSLYPLPDAVYVLSTRYKINAGDTLDLADTAVVGDPVFSECYKEAVLATAEVVAFGQAGAHSQRFAELLIEAVRQDNKMQGVRYGRPRSGISRRSRFFDLITAKVDMSGQEPV